MRYLQLFCLWLLVGMLAGCGTPSFLITPVANTSQIEEITVAKGAGWSPSKVAIIEVEGILANARTGGFMQPTENALSLFTQQLARAAEDDSVKAVVLRINSPGGTVTASDTMYQMVEKFRATTHKPVIASAQDITASGAYYIACAADKIVVHPTSVVGSIGVIFNTFDVSDGMAKLGIRSVAIKSAPLKDLASPFHHISDEERAVMQAMVDEYYHRFIHIVQSNRHITDEPTLKLVTDGRVFSGTRAVELGLADQTGLLPDALALAQTMANCSNASIIMYKRPYGYRGSIYASDPAETPQANTLRLELPIAQLSLPPGFYYLWQP
ncbi:MAG: signal peptide peptidase SppA [Phycisphaerales bacterium]|nr:signal peptide peptidase SppA [Phycisphaerales bacterium]